MAHYSPKKRVTDFAFASRPAPLERAYFLEEAPQVEVVPGREGALGIGGSAVDAE